VYAPQSGCKRRPQRARQAVDRASLRVLRAHPLVEYLSGNRWRAEPPVAWRRVARGHVGPLIRQRRAEMRLSQLALALDLGVSPRHLSFVELGKSRPSPELLLLIADRLELTLRDQNSWLLAAGYAPRFPETPLDGPRLRQVSASVQTLLDAHEPYPATALDGEWTVRLFNQAAVRLGEGIPDEVGGVPTNIFRVCLHPDGFASRTRNFTEWAAYLLRQLDRLAHTGSPGLVALADEIAGWPNIPPRRQWSRSTPYADTPVIPWIIQQHDVELSFFTVLATIGSPLDVTLDELTVEFFFPANEETARQLNMSRAAAQCES
jgi:transcriptional regulator with XRE-family HTH domain